MIGWTPCTGDVSETVLVMEGALLKWTNYLSGWQPRYFVLENGILSYYDSQDDVGKGSKGSIKMAVCEIKDLDLSNESLGRKLSELRLYCDVLTQQVLAVQEATHPQDNGSPLDIQKMNEASSLLRATCSQFISTLEECMKFANTRLAPELYHPLVVPQPSDFVGTKLPHSHRVRRSMSHTGIVSSDRALEAARVTPAPPQGTVTVLRNLEEMVMFRSQHWGQQTSRAGSPAGTIVEETADPPLPAQDSPLDSAGSNQLL
ncbi:pleckstrin homology domain-containing family A member 3-like isoform X4 [Hemicordylus capensis]|uniref:pleckstrin homology domain-containing family A member 3-like isoform X4 n=1 Tax=Hemicordylus capensis TaxID=884348 RepID=UPI002302C382|nr:pleckstrin homology domain-containing family A member 3-like isoform X4 [Hemicordylus capensis]